MSPLVALFIVTWAAIVLLFFGLAAVMREVRLLRGIAVRDPDGFTAAPPDLTLGGPFAGGGGSRAVLAVDSGCSLCLAITERLARREAQVTLLTHEPPAVWQGVAGELPIVSDRELWRSVAHLSPPVLMLVDGSGRVRKLLLPVREQEVDRVLEQWRSAANEGSPDVVDVGADT
jgi:hypothetical protein